MFSNFCCYKVLLAKLEACRHKSWVQQIIPIGMYVERIIRRGMFVECLSTEGTFVHCFLFQAVERPMPTAVQSENISCVQRDSILVSWLSMVSFFWKQSIQFMPLSVRKYHIR